MGEMSSSESKAATIPKEYDLDVKWDACLDLSLRRLAYSSLAAAFSGLLLFRSPATRWASVAFGAGLGLGSAYTDCSRLFDKPTANLRPAAVSESRVAQTKKDPYLEAKMERVPFLEEQMRKVNEGGGLLSGDIDRLMKSEENRFAFVNEIAAEAKAYVNNNRDEYGTKKAILHVLSNRMNEAGFPRPEAYLETDPFQPSPTDLRVELT